IGNVYKNFKNHFQKGISMVPGDFLVMGNGSIKAPRLEETCLGSSIKETPLWESAEHLKLRIARLEEELARRDQELCAQELQLQTLQRELEAKVLQIDKLQDAIGYNNLGRSPPAPARPSHRLLSVINQGSTRFHRVAVEVHRRLKAKEGVSAEPTSGHFCKEHRTQHVSIERTRILFNIFFCSVSLLKDLPEEKLAKIVDCLEIDYFDKGEYIIREGEEGNTFFIIAKGEVSVTQSTEGYSEPLEIKILGVGDYFGEKALISEDVRSANIIAKENDTQCLVVDRDNFNQMVGTYEELQAYLREYVEQLSINDERRIARSPQAAELRSLHEKAARLSSCSFLQQLQIIATLGMGGFGRVELVKLKNEDTAFALKCIKKKHIVDTRQQEHIYSEKNILQQTNCNFIVRLFRTFRDEKYVYMLLEVCLGGELWSVLRDMSFFEEATARFCIGCVLEAFDYLHGMGIVYRDLKPENLLLDAEGYVKMTDFGFAKRIGLGKKTWTFCGTPEYVAPEVIMNKGHDFGADCWSLGILIFELLIGSPPFSGSDPIKIYTMVLHGIEKVDIPKRISKRPEDLIRRLCKLNPAERLGNKKNGIIDIKKHKWFQGFNWEGLRRRKLASPKTFLTFSSLH
uniref:cGMP-dependent protein kinase n=1 Tax=Astyanax mexicanus TaxID=7994 RepID=A0A8B9LC62_ASTMX